MLSACLLLFPFISCTQVQDTKGDAVIEQKIETLLSRMTLEEKIGQMNQISSYGNIEDMSGLIKKGEVGSILNEVDPVRVNALQRVAMEESRLGIPLLMARDVIHGFKTIFPIPLGQAASFNPQVAEDGARVAAVEASAAGIRWTFAPMIDVARDPRWGRMAEGCGEDTYLTSVMGAAMVKGFQGDSLNHPTSIAACPKHFVGYGAAEGGRDYNSTFIPERRLRNVYLPPFEAAAAARADVILAFVGEEAILSGEAHCLADLNLQGAQSELIAALAKTGKPVVTVVMAGRPLTIGKEVELSSAVLYSFHPGTMGGPALADLLWGKAVPSGKTPVTFPKMVGQIPVYYAHNSSGRPATRNEVLLNDIPLEAGQTSLGCTSFYMDAGFDPLYPFGYGLSYTTFKYDNVKLSSANLKKEDVLTVTFDLENTGKYEGTEVAQLYVQDKFASVTRPVKELKRFARVTLKPGEKKNVSFELPISELAFWNIDMVKTVEAGDFALWVAPDSQSGEEVFFKVVD